MYLLRHFYESYGSVGHLLGDLHAMALLKIVLLFSQQSFCESQLPQLHYYTCPLNYYLFLAPPVPAAQLIVMLLEIFANSFLI